MVSIRSGLRYLCITGFTNKEHMNKHYIVAGLLLAGLAASGTAYAAVDTTALQGKVRSHMGQGGRGHGAVEAQLLGLTQDEFRTRIQNGENPKEMLAAAGITREDMESAREVAMRERLAQAVQSGKLTQAQADARIADMQNHRATHDAVRVALQNKDFAAFKAAVAGSPFESEVTAENFAQFAEAHRLMESGDREAAKAIMDELGITPGRHGKGMGGMGHRANMQQK